jgi:hypothetical protein
MHEFENQSKKKMNRFVYLIYFTIFKENYNLDFFKPKKRIVLQCKKFKNDKTCSKRRYNKLLKSY